MCKLARVVLIMATLGFGACAGDEQEVSPMDTAMAPALPEPEPVRAHALSQVLAALNYLAEREAADDRSARRQRTRADTLAAQESHLRWYIAYQNMRCLWSVALNESEKDAVFADSTWHTRVPSNMFSIEPGGVGEDLQTIFSHGGREMPRAYFENHLYAPNDWDYLSAFDFAVTDRVRREESARLHERGFACQ